MTIIDTHAHLDQISDIEGAFKRAQDANVSDIVVMGVDLKSIQKNLEIKRSFRAPRIHLAFGIHPGNLEDVIPAQAGIQSDSGWIPAFAGVTETFDFIRKNIKEAVAIGETGLDYTYKWAHKNEVEQHKQRAIFQKHLELAKEFDLPIVIHSRGAEADCLAMAKSVGVRRANFHWYSGPLDILKDILDAGFFVSCSPAVVSSPKSREAMRFAPIERTLIETDSPVFFRETADRGFQSEPKDVWRTLKAYAELKQVEEEIALKMLNKNALEFFKL